MSDDDDLPVRRARDLLNKGGGDVRYDPPASRSSGSKVQLPRRSYLEGKIRGAESRAALEYERTETDRARNAVAYIEAQTDGERALHAFNTVQRDNDLYDAQREATIAREMEDANRSSKMAAAQISEFEAVAAKYEADKEAELDRASEARLRREAREAKASGSNSTDIQTKIKTRQDRQQECLVEMMELDEEIASFQDAAGKGDPVAAGKLRARRAQQVLLNEEIERLKREINQFSAEL